MRLIILTFVLLSNALHTYAQDEVVNYDISSNIQLVGLAYNAQICTGQEIQIALNNVSISTTNTHYKWANFDDCIAYYNLSVDYQEENTSLVWSGDGLRSDPTNRNVMYATPNSAGVYSVKWETVEFFPANKCRAAYKKTTRYSGTTRPVTIIPLTKMAEISGYSTKYPGTSSNAIALQVDACNSDESIIWQPALSNSTYINNIYYIFDTGSCNEYKVRCNQPRCNYPEKWSNPVKPANYFKPKDAAYSPEYANYLQRKLNESVGKPEYPYRKQYTCIYEKASNEYNNSGDSGWGGGFVKHLFDNMATQNPCSSSIDEDCNGLNSLFCTMSIGGGHFWNELIPNFSGYAGKPNIDYDNWDNQHDAFLTNAVEVCFDELFSDPNFNHLCAGSVNIGDTEYTLCVRDWLSKLGSKYSAIYGAKFVRNWAQFMVKTGRGFSILWNDYNSNRENSLINIPIPEPIAKHQIFSAELQTVSQLKVKHDTTFFLHVNQSAQLEVIFKDASGNVSNLTNSSTGTTYELNVDSTVATISENGLIYIKSTSLPFLNGRLPLYVLATNGTKTGVGQFAIIDSDTDTDLIVDSYERRIGLNPNVPNLGDSDGDYLLDTYEAIIGSNPLAKDSDNDGFGDGRELKSSTNLTNNNSFPIPVYSVSSGNWNNTSVWSCECIPTNLNNVIINEGHSIMLPSDLNAECNTILIKTGAVFSSPMGAKLNILNLNK
jgi:hypothetical protein